MFNLEVEGRSEPTVEEIESAYATGDWDRQVVSIELFLPDEKLLYEFGMKFWPFRYFEAGRLYSVDRLMHIPMGGVHTICLQHTTVPKKSSSAFSKFPQAAFLHPYRFKGFVLSSRRRIPRCQQG